MPTAEATRGRSWLTPVLLAALLVGCSGEESGREPLTAELPLHLEDHLGAATIVGSEVPAEVQQPVEWRFDEPQPAWTSARLPPSLTPVRTRTQDALRLSVEEEVNMVPFGTLWGGTIYVDLPDWKREDWEHVLVRARTSENVQQLRLAFNLRENRGAQDSPFRFSGESVDVINDGAVQSYLLRADLRCYATSQERK